jgi:hypothetical protein
VNTQDRHARGDERYSHLLRTGCPWGCLPRDSFPPRSTVYNIFRKFQRDGEAIMRQHPKMSRLIGDMTLRTSVSKGQLLIFAPAASGALGVGSRT